MNRMFLGIRPPFLTIWRPVAVAVPFGLLTLHVIYGLSPSVPSEWDAIGVAAFIMALAIDSLFLVAMARLVWLDVCELANNPQALHAYRTDESLSLSWRSVSGLLGALTLILALVLQIILTAGSKMFVVSLMTLSHVVTLVIAAFVCDVAHRMINKFPLTLASPEQAHRL
jgi:hypothetical protein